MSIFPFLSQKQSSARMKSAKLRSSGVNMCEPSYLTNLKWAFFLGCCDAYETNYCWMSPFQLFKAWFEHRGFLEWSLVLAWSLHICALKKHLKSQFGQSKGILDFTGICGSTSQILRSPVHFQPVLGPKVLCKALASTFLDMSPRNVVIFSRSSMDSNSLSSKHQLFVFFLRSRGNWKGGAWELEVRPLSQLSHLVGQCSYAVWPCLCPSPGIAWQLYWWHTWR